METFLACTVRNDLDLCRLVGAFGIRERAAMVDRDLDELLYTFVAERILQESDIPSDLRGIFFNNPGHAQIEMRERHCVVGEAECGDWEFPTYYLLEPSADGWRLYGWGEYAPPLGSRLRRIDTRTPPSECVVAHATPLCGLEAERRSWALAGDFAMEYALDVHFFLRLEDVEASSELWRRHEWNLPGVARITIHTRRCDSPGRCAHKELWPHYFSVGFIDGLGWEVLDHGIDMRGGDLSSVPRTRRTALAARRR